MLRKNHLRSRAFMGLGALAFLAMGFTLGRTSGEITPATIDSAAELIGLTFSPQEKDSMISTLTKQRENFEVLRKTKLDNSVGPSFLSR
jgi:hypothetical protein